MPGPLFLIFFGNVGMYNLHAYAFAILGLTCIQAFRQYPKPFRDETAQRGGDNPTAKQGLIITAKVCRYRISLRLEGTTGC